jgi:hypothetical protein
MPPMQLITPIMLRKLTLTVFVFSMTPNNLLVLMIVFPLLTD